MTGLELGELSKQQVQPVLGCTEPSAIGLAAGLCRWAMGGYAPEWLGGNGATGPLGPVEHLEVEIDANVYKNAFAVGIPRTGGKVGIELAAALGSLCNPALGLNLFSSAGREELR